MTPPGAPAPPRTPTRLVQLQQRHVDALQRAGAAGCATCQPKPHPPVPHLPPATYTLRFHEFRDAIAALDVWDSKATLGPQRWQDAAAGNTIYIFRRLHNTTTLVHTQRGGAPYTLTVKPADAGARFFACVSQFAIPAGRIAQYLAPNGYELVRARCAALDLGDRRTMHPAGGTTYDVALCDYRRGSAFLWKLTAFPLTLIEKWSTDVDRATTRVLAAVLLSVIRDRAKENHDVYSWLRNPNAVQQTLSEFASEESRQQGFAENHATRLYGWMMLPAYREMLYDGVFEPTAAREAIIAEGTMVGAAARTEAGHRFLRRHAMLLGQWWARCISQLTSEEKTAVRAGGEATTAFATMLTAIGSARLGALHEQFATRKDGFRVDNGVKFSKELFDIFKNVFGFGDALARQPWSKGVEKLADALKDEAKTLAAGRAAVASSAAHAAAATKHVVDLETALKGMRALVIEETWVRATVMVWGKRPPLLSYSIREQEFHLVRVRDAGPALFQPDVQAWLAPVRDDAASARSAAGEAAIKAAHDKREAAHEVLEFRSEALGRAGFSGASAAFGSAFAIANAILVWQAFESEHRLRSTVESIGATGDLLFSAEFFVEMTGVAARGVGGVLGSLGIAAGGTLGVVRGAGFVGAVISVALGLVDAGNAVADREYGLTTGYGLGVIGNIGVATVIGSSAYATIFGETAFTTAVGGSRLLGPAAVLVVVIGAGVVWYYKSHELQRFVEHSRWGKLPQHDTAPKQLDALLHLLSGPAVAAREYDRLPSPPGGSASGRYGVCFTVRPGLFLADQSALSVSLHVQITSHAPPIAISGNIGSSMPQPVTIDDPDIGGLRFDVGPLAVADILRAKKGEVLLGRIPVRGVTGAAAPSVTVDFTGGPLPIFRLYVPLIRHLSDDPPPRNESRWDAFWRNAGESLSGGRHLLTYGARGQATLRLWAPGPGQESAGHPREGTATAQLLSDVEFKPFDLGDIDMQMLR